MTPNEDSLSHFVVLWEITHIKQRLPIEFKPIKFKGQTSEEVGNFYRRTRMNTWVDKTSGEYLDYCIDHNKEKEIQDFCTSRWSIWISENVDKTLEKYKHGNKLIRYCYK